MTQVRPFAGSNFYCPICKQYEKESAYLRSVFPEHPRTRYLANLITHYRHSHITSYNKSYGYGSGAYATKSLQNYASWEEFKSDINERAKRQYARKAGAYFKKWGIGVSQVRRLQGTTPETLSVWKKIFGSRKPKAKENCKNKTKR